MLKKACSLSNPAAMLALAMTLLWSLPYMTAQAETYPNPNSNPAPARVYTLTSHHDFAATVARLKDTLVARGLTLFADIDQSQAATQAGTSLRPTRLFLFGNPKGGTPAMQANPHAAIELPLRAVVWQDEQGLTHIDYLDAGSVLVNDYGVAENLAAPLAGAKALMESVAAQ